MVVQFYHLLEFGGYSKCLFLFLIWRAQDSTIDNMCWFRSVFITVTTILSAEYHSILYFSCFVFLRWVIIWPHRVYLWSQLALCRWVIFLHKHPAVNDKCTTTTDGNANDMHVVNGSVIQFQMFIYHQQHDIDGRNVHNLRPHHRRTQT